MGCLKSFPSRLNGLLGCFCSQLSPHLSLSILLFLSVNSRCERPAEQMKGQGRSQDNVRHCIVGNASPKMYSPSWEFRENQKYLFSPVPLSSWTTADLTKGIHSLATTFRHVVLQDFLMERNFPVLLIVLIGPLNWCYRSISYLKYCLLAE